jgi:surfeit locus 1 family protein
LRRNLPFLIFAAVVLAILVSLGTWQMRRLHEKETYLAAVTARIGGAPQAIPADPDPIRDRFLAVEATGQLIGPEIHVLISTRDFGAGYRVIQAFETAGRKVLVDRGIIRTTEKNSARETAELRLTGNLYWPDEIDSYTPANDLAANIWYARDVAAMARALDTETTMIILRETSEADPSVTPLPVDTSSIPNRHLEYVLTWYGLAVTWVVMTLYFLRRRRGQDKGTS